MIWYTHETLVITESNVPKLSPGKLTKPLDGSKNMSSDADAVSSKTEAKAGGSNVLPFAMYMDLIAYLCS